MPGVARAHCYVHAPPTPGRGPSIAGAPPYVGPPQDCRLRFTLFGPSRHAKQLDPHTFLGSELSIVRSSNSNGNGNR